MHHFSKSTKILRNKTIYLDAYHFNEEDEQFRSLFCGAIRRKINGYGKCQTCGMLRVKLANFTIAIIILLYIETAQCNLT